MNIAFMDMSISLDMHIDTHDRTSIETIHSIIKAIQNRLDTVIKHFIETISTLI